MRLFFEKQPGALPAIRREPVPDLKEFAQQLLSTGDVTEDIVDRVNLGMQQRIAEFQQADRRYWRDIIVELKQLRGTGALMPMDAAV